MKVVDLRRAVSEHLDITNRVIIPTGDGSTCQTCLMTFSRTLTSMREQLAGFAVSDEADESFAYDGLAVLEDFRLLEESNCDDVVFLDDLPLDAQPPAPKQRCGGRAAGVRRSSRSAAHG